MNPLVTLNEVKEFLVIKTTSTDDDARLSNIALQVSQLVSSYCGRTFEVSNFSEYFDGGTASVFISNPPIQNINEVSWFNGSDYAILGSPGEQGQPISVEGKSHSPQLFGNSSLTTRVKKFNKSSLKLDGNSNVTVAVSDDWNLGEADFTVETYIRPTANTGSIFNIGDTWKLSLVNYIPVLESYVSNVSILTLTSNVNIDSTKFYHVAAVKDEDTVSLYLNGELVNSVSSFTTIVPYNNSELVIGNNFSGYIDNFRITHKAEYLANFTTYDYSFSTTPETKLLLRFDGNNGSTNIVDDSRRVNEYAVYKETGEISFDVGHGGGTPELGFYTISTSSNYPKGVKVDYTGGFTSIPSDLKLAVLEMIKIIHKGRSGTERAAMSGESHQSFLLSSDDFPPQVRRVLNLYKLVV